MSQNYVRQYMAASAELQTIQVIAKTFQRSFKAGIQRPVQVMLRV